jgi:hypothetical protein
LFQEGWSLTMRRASIRLLRNSQMVAYGPILTSGERKFRDLVLTATTSSRVDPISTETELQVP